MPFKRRCVLLAKGSSGAEGPRDFCSCVALHLDIVLRHRARNQLRPADVDLARALLHVMAPKLDRDATTVQQNCGMPV